MENYLKIHQTTRFESIGDASCNRLLIVLHGYGQLARFFIKKFKSLENKWHIVAPEGMHRFYKNGSSGRVGSSWMTKEMRLNDIEDNLNYLTELFIHLNKHNNYQEIVLLGFSQGAATAARYFYSEHNIAHKLVIWASVFPPDIKPSELFNFQKNKEQPLFVLGKQDEFFNIGSQKEVINFYRQLGFKIIEFEGNHDIDIGVLQQIF